MALGEGLRDNPFYVLELPTTATTVEIERSGNKILGMLELDLGGARTYTTPLGAAERDADKVRRAMSELRDPAKRAVHELWARLPPEPVVELGDPERFAADRRELSAPWLEAMEALGWSRR
jgi:curved DNA-binding protein CbpA